MSVLLVKYFFYLVEEYSKGKIHKGEPEPRNGNVNAVYFINQARGNTRISCMEFVYNEIACDCQYLLYKLNFLLRIMFVKSLHLQISFTLKHYKLPTLQVNVRIFSMKFEG